MSSRSLDILSNLNFIQSKILELQKEVLTTQDDYSLSDIEKKVEILLDIFLSEEDDDIIELSNRNLIKYQEEFQQKEQKEQKETLEFSRIYDVGTKILWIKTNEDEINKILINPINIDETELFLKEYKIEGASRSSIYRTNTLIWINVHEEEKDIVIKNNIHISSVNTHKSEIIEPIKIRTRCFYSGDEVLWKNLNLVCLILGDNGGGSENPQYKAIIKEDSEHNKKVMGDMKFIEFKNKLYRLGDMVRPRQNSIKIYRKFLPL